MLAKSVKFYEQLIPILMVKYLSVYKILLNGLPFYIVKTLIMHLTYINQITDYFLLLNSLFYCKTIYVRRRFIWRISRSWEKHENKSPEI